MRRPKQHRLRLERDAGFALFQDFTRDIAGLIDLVAHAHQSRPLGGDPVRPQAFGETFLCLFNDCIRGGKDRLRRAVVAFECDDLGARREMAGKVEDIAHRCRPERVDGLGIVADDRQPSAIGLQGQKDRRLQPVGVLIFVHQHVIEAIRHIVGDGGHSHHLRPIEQQIVVIEHVLALLGFDIGREQSA